MRSMHTENRTNAHEKRAANVDGDFWVDKTCINCDTCRWMSPSFKMVDEQSAVLVQPQSHAERVRALQALLSCPTFSIHVDHRSAEELQEAQRGLPAPVPGVPGVFHCGWHDVKSFACTSYLIQRPAAQGGNILVDSPRFNPVLARQLEALGGVSVIFLTHRDDVGDHARWAAHFKAPRVLHQDEVNTDTAGVEVKLQGAGPWRLSAVLPAPAPGPDGAAPPAAGSAGGGVDDGVELVFTPGHTEGHVCLYHPATRTLFAGDHLSSPPEVDGQADQLYAFTDFNWYDVDKQLDSVVKLLQWDWINVLPGHGRMAFLGSAEGRLAAISKLMAQHGRPLPAVPATAGLS